MDAGGLPHLLMGSVAEAIFRSATCPVLTVGPHVTRKPFHDFTVDNILFPTDLGEHAQFAAQYALSVAQESSADLTFLHVVPLEEVSRGDQPSVVERSFKKLDKIVPAEAREWCKPKLVVEVGDPVKELLAFAGTERPDLIVLGLPAGKKFNGHFRTGVTYNIVAGAPCPVLTVRDLTNQD